MRRILDRFLLQAEVVEITARVTGCGNRKGKCDGPRDGCPAFCFPRWQSRTANPVVFRENSVTNDLWRKSNVIRDSSIPSLRFMVIPA
ncbi:MAG: hypothetical protein CMJ78_11680 [Planctomycetaceae bacterium]|nr:hypothetical protein [Planctomycetaceae bacterium]